jgi:hypothetical protein
MQGDRMFMLFSDPKGKKLHSTILRACIAKIRVPAIARYLALWEFPWLRVNVEVFWW